MRSDRDWELAPAEVGSRLSSISRGRKYYLVWQYGLRLQRESSVPKKSSTKLFGFCHALRER
jgi:hypothetical protein